MRPYASRRHVRRLPAIPTGQVACAAIAGVGIRHVSGASADDSCLQWSHADCLKTKLIDDFY